MGGFAGRKVGLVKRRNTQGEEILVEELINEDGTPTGQAAPAIDQGSNARDFAGVPANGSNGGAPAAGKLTITVLDATNLADEVKSHVAVTVGSKTHKTGHSHSKSTSADWNEALHFHLDGGVSTAIFAVYEHKTLGKDRTIGTGEFDIWSIISPAMPAGDVTVSLGEGQGSIRARLEFFPAGSSLSSASKEHIPLSPRKSISSHASPSKFSAFSRKKDSAVDE